MTSSGKTEVVMMDSNTDRIRSKISLIGFDA